MVTPAKQHIEAITDVRKELARSRSSGIKGVSLRFSRRTNMVRPRAAAASRTAAIAGAVISTSAPTTSDARAPTFSARLTASSLRAELVLRNHEAQQRHAECQDRRRPESVLEACSDLPRQRW